MVLLLTLVVALAACRPLQPPAGNPSDLMERYVHQVIFDMRDSFVAADIGGFMKHVSEGFYGGRARLEESRSSLQTRTCGDIMSVVELDCNVHDAAFAKACAETLLEMMPDNQT